MTRDYWGLGNSIPVTYLPMETSPKLKQKVCRTSTPGSPNKLQELLDDGWKVVFATPLSNGMIEYILEKYV